MARPADSATQQAVARLRARLEPAVKAEAEEQARQQLAAYSRRSAQRLQADGLVLLGLAAAPEGRLYTDFVWRFSPPGGAQLPYHRFKRGDTLLLTPWADAGGSGQQRRRGSGSGSGSGAASGGDEDGGEGGQLEGTVLDVSRGELSVSVAKEVAEALGAAPPGARWRLDQVRGRASGWAAVSPLIRITNSPHHCKTACRDRLLGCCARPSAWSCTRRRRLAPAHSSPGPLPRRRRRA